MKMTAGIIASGLCLDQALAGSSPTTVISNSCIEKDIGMVKGAKPKISRYQFQKC
jgi:hypothetical protein